MRGGVPGSVCVLAWVLVGCAGRGATGGKSSTAAAPGAAAQGDAPPEQAFGERCVAQPSRSRDGMRVSCDDDAMRFVVPGTDWSIEPSPAPSVVVFASSGPLNLSIRVADEGESRYAEHEHLEAILNGVSQALTEKGHRVLSPRFEETGSGAVVLWYEVAVAADGAEALRMVNAWRAVRGADGRYLDYHVSFSAAPDDPAWTTASGRAGPRERVVNLAEVFAVRPAR